MQVTNSGSAGRAAGILLHPTSLPSPHGIGDLGEGAFRFIDWLAEAGLTRWQFLPLVPAGPGNSPYATPAALANHPLVVDLRGLVADGLLSAEAIQRPPDFSPDFADFARVLAFKRPLLEAAADALVSGRVPHLRAEFETFRHEAGWADDAAAFLAIRESHGGAPWWTWPAALRDREPSALAAAVAELAVPITRHVAAFFFFARQWRAVRAHAALRGVRLIGDVPIYVDRDSVDVWSHREIFQLTPEGEPTAVAGVPPDFFSTLGQRWGNPLYDWGRLAADGHRWWIERMRRALADADIVRLDHFRGFAAYWEVPADAPDARTGRWVEGPGRRLFDDLAASLGTPLPLIAEDLGIIDDAVGALRDAVGLPGMRVLQFAFGGESDHAFLPHNYVVNSVVYTATHDNDTTMGWWQTTDDRARDHVRRYLGVHGNDVVWDLIRAAFASVAGLAIVPLQDVLCLDGRSRMNTPGESRGNWAWRVRMQAFNAPLAARLRELSGLYGRMPTPA